ncbi:MAG: SDR family oxidoreductase [Desulfobacterales bacterium]|nr:MAG: SDR family oxidoreductase [Desulfobacterales bacterium]
MRLKDKVALITGAGMGQGRAACLVFAREGAPIVALDIDADAGQETVALVQKKGGEAIFCPCDVAFEEQVQKSVAAGVAAFGRLNILYNNAAVLWRDKDFGVTATIEANWNRVMDINLKGAVWVCKYGVPELIKAGGGSIINTASLSALLGFTVAQDAYTCSKGALISLTRSLAIVHARDNIRANTIHPGPVDTPMQKQWDEETKKAIAEWVPLGRLAQPEDIANCALFLASDESSYITGAEIVVDGGIMVKGG